MDTAVAKSLQDKLYDKRKAGALEYVVSLPSTPPPLRRVRPHSHGGGHRRLPPPARPGQMQN